MSLEFISPQLATAVDHPPPRAGLDPWSQARRLPYRPSKRAWEALRCKVCVRHVGAVWDHHGGGWKLWRTASSTRSHSASSWASWWFIEVVPRCGVCGRIATKPTGVLPRHMFCIAVRKRERIPAWSGPAPLVQALGTEVPGLTSQEVSVSGWLLRQ